MMSTMKDFLDSLREKLQEKIDSGADGQTFILAALGVLDILESRAAIFEKLGSVGLEDLLHLAFVSTDVRVAAIRQMSADQLIADMQLGTAQLEADTAKRKAMEEDLLALLKELGEYGAKFALALLF